MTTWYVRSPDGSISIPTLKMTNDTTITGGQRRYYISRDESNVLYRTANGISFEPTSRTINLYSTNTTAEIQAKIDSVGKFIPYGVIITFYFNDGTYTLTYTLSFNGFHGPGQITIKSSGTETALNTAQPVTINVAENQSGLAFAGCYCKVKIYNLKIYLNPQHYGITASEYSVLEVYYCYIYGSSAGNGAAIFMFSESFAYVRSTYFSNITYAMAAYQSRIRSSGNDDTGTQPAYAYRAYGGSLIQIDNISLVGSTATYLADSGGLIVTVAGDVLPP